MDFIQELSWRNMLHDRTPEVDEHLSTGMRTGYIGFDPTAPALTIGNYVQIMLLNLFQKAGHQPVVLMGGATGRIGDPSGKDAERQLKSFDELDNNLASQAAAMRKLLNFDEGPNKAIIVNNLDFYKNMNVLTFLRDVGKTVTINYMTSKESVKRRIETGLSFTEFSYQLLQAYDFQCLFQEQGVTLQMGGSDQWGNITSGTEFIRKNLGEKAFAVTTPLLTKADGTKFGKSTSGNIWLDPKLTSPYEFYQFWLRADDRDTAKFMRYFTFKSKDEVEALEAEYAENPRDLKSILAEELTKRIHGEEAYESVLKVSQLLFNAKAKKDTLLALSQKELGMVAKDITSPEVALELIQSGVGIVELLTQHTGLIASNGDVRRAIKGNALSVNKDKVTSHELIISADHLLHGKYIMVENGKKNKFLIQVK
ncbi:MAG: tyrosine--tRNA ligase [Bacteroidota bacterium]